MARLTPTKSQSASVDAAVAPLGSGSEAAAAAGKKKAKSGGFESMGLCEEVYRGVRHKGYCVPTPIQRKTMPLILAGLDVAAKIQVGHLDLDIYSYSDKHGC